jgi:hypothetical protein
VQEPIRGVHIDRIAREPEQWKKVQKLRKVGFEGLLDSVLEQLRQLSLVQQPSQLITIVSVKIILNSKIKIFGI